MTKSVSHRGSEWTKGAIGLQWARPNRYPAEDFVLLLLSLLLPAVLLVMLRLLERYERRLDEPFGVEASAELAASSATVAPLRSPAAPTHLVEPAAESA